MIEPNTGIPATPPESQLIQVAFAYPLNYPFVLQNALSQAQIFQWLPVGIELGLGLSNNSVVMQSLKPYDTTASLGYVTTLAMAYIPKGFVDSLQLAIRTSVSEIYNTKNPSVNTLMSYINPAIGIQVGSTIGAGTTAADGGAPASSPPNVVDAGGIFNTASQSTSSGIKGSTAGIVVGVAGAAAAYGAGMFFIARRYKRRQQVHRRSSSIVNASEMRQAGSALTGGVFMSGGRLSPVPSPPYLSEARNSHGSGQSSARTAQISAPMMAENSLGWN